MTPQNTLDLKGNFNTYPFGELLVEIAQAELSGSLRLFRQDRKTNVYFRNGEVVYTVSNSREHRLFNIFLGQNKIDKQILAGYPNFANDLEFSVMLQEKSLFSKAEIDAAVITQIEQIIIEALTWADGDWVFSPLAKVRSDLIYGIDTDKLLFQYARCLPSAYVLQRFKSVHEAFSAVPERMSDPSLQAHEQSVRSKFADTPLTIEQLRPLCNLPESGLFQALYALWLGGLIARRDWNTAFSDNKIGEIRRARVSLVKEAQTPDSHKVKTPSLTEQILSESVVKEAVAPVIEISLEEYLERVEKSETYYDTLGVAEEAPLSDLKNSYLTLVKQFHPDLFHRQDGVNLLRIQAAFTSLAHAYETLKLPESRENYDFKIRKELELREKRRAEGIPDRSPQSGLNTEDGLESFEHGLKLLLDEDFHAAAVYFARAVHYSPENALYHAYYGKALSDDESMKHKALGEIQHAAKLDPKNPKIRLMLVEFLVDMNMQKRAEGELKRFLEIVPENQEARDLLGQM